MFGALLFPSSRNVTNNIIALPIHNTGERKKDTRLQKYQNSLHKKCFSNKITKHTQLQHIVFCHNAKCDIVEHVTCYCCSIVDVLHWGRGGGGPGEQVKYRTFCVHLWEKAFLSEWHSYSHLQSLSLVKHLLIYIYFVTVDSNECASSRVLLI